MTLSRVFQERNGRCVKKEKKNERNIERAGMHQRLRDAATVKLAMGMQLPAETIARLPRLEMTGNRELVVDGVRSVTEYGETVICLDCGRVAVTVSGASLCMERYFGEATVITGILTSVEFS